MDSSLFAHRSHALRSGRFSEPNRAYLLTTVTYGRVPIFTDWCAARLLVAEMRQAHDQQLVTSLAWVIMPDHLHWLVQLGSLPLPSLMQRIKSRSAIALRQAGVDHTEKVWQKGFHDHALRHDEDLQDVARYIVANPLRAGLVKRVGDYPLWDAAWL
ncbi:REP-associated tyrosine transposase [Pseudomonas schmalbachii]|uniref:Transposase n=1 Tax=Pseudomonas schmalbachii TaxID=2816993 RepID=A0ABS3TRA2_9PSED|nr:transposase [Pseudomonas schmalbachii]MBO3275114.1 transposase [Pseudomonas schmalbachii]